MNQINLCEIGVHMSNLNPGHNQKIILWFLASFFIIVSTITFLLFAQNNEPNSYIKINEAYYILNEGESTLITFKASQELGAFTYTSNDTSVVQFIENRIITVGTGSTVITVSSQSNPSIFQTVSVIVREREIETVVPEVPVDPEPEEEVVIPTTIYTVTIINETGTVITTLEVEEGSFINEEDLDLPEFFKGFFLEGETCSDDSFDLETSVTENLTLTQASFNDQAPCLQLDSIVLSGIPVAGTELTVDIFPMGANVTISWSTSVNNRMYREIPGESGTTFTVRPEDSGKFIRVYVVSDSNPPVVKYDTIKLDVFGTVSDSGGGTSTSTPSTIATGSVVNISADDPSSFASYTLEGGVTVTSITNTSVFDFNGSSGHIDLGQPLNANTSFTFEAWVFDETSDFNRNIISSKNTVFFINGKTLQGGVGGAFNLVQKENFILKKWKHTVLTFDDPNNTLKMYINGLEVSTATTTNSFNGEILRAGAHFGSSAVSFWAGMMNDIRVYNRALTADEVSGNYTATKNKYE